jgi:hypothetical protein
LATLRSDAPSKPIVEKASRAASMIRARESPLGCVDARFRAARPPRAGFADSRRFSSGEKIDLPFGKFSSYIIFQL